MPEIAPGVFEGGNPAPDPVLPRRITRFAFRSRFTLAERAAIEFAAVDDPGASTPARQQAAMLRAYLRDMAEASYVDLDREDVTDGLATLEGAGLIAAGRADAIASAEVADHERYSG